MAKKKTTKGIVIAAYGRAGYGYAAFNLFRSIRYYNSEIPVTLLYDNVVENNLEELSDFESKIKLDDNLIYHNGKIDPAKVKFEMYDLLPYDENLILDADNIAFKDLGKLIDKLSEMKKDFICQYVHCGKKSDGIDYMWASNEDTWTYFDLKENDQYCTMQSSVLFVRKNAKTEKLYNEFKTYFYKGFYGKSLKKWGGTLADEFIIGGVLAKNKIDASCGFKIDFLGHRDWDLELTEIQDKHWMLALYGQGIGTNRLTKDQYIHWADRIMQEINTAFNAPNKYKMAFIMRDKHVNFLQK